jgi:hypothetical protein
MGSGRAWRETREVMERDEDETERRNDMADLAAGARIGWNRVATKKEFVR